MLTKAQPWTCTGGAAAVLGRRAPRTLTFAGLVGGRWRGAAGVKRVASLTVREALCPRGPGKVEPAGGTEAMDNASSGASLLVSGNDSALPSIAEKSSNIFWHDCPVVKNDRDKQLNQKGCVLWITGLSGSGKSTLACTLSHKLHSRGHLAYVLDGDNLRHGLNRDLGFKAEDRAENIRRVGEVAKLFADAGLICITSLISPYKKDRDACRELLPNNLFIEIFLDVPLEVCEKRDAKGLYKLARDGKIKGFTGVDDPYEAPSECEIVIGWDHGKCPSPGSMADQVVSYLEDTGYLGGE